MKITQTDTELTVISEYSWQLRTGAYAIALGLLGCIVGIFVLKEVLTTCIALAILCVGLWAMTHSSQLKLTVGHDGTVQLSTTSYLPKKTQSKTYRTSQFTSVKYTTSYSNLKSAGYRDGSTIFLKSDTLGTVEVGSQTAPEARQGNQPLAQAVAEQIAAFMNLPLEVANYSPLKPHI